MDIDLGCRMIIEFPGKVRMNCQFVGMVVDEFLLLKVPLSPGIRDRLAEGVSIQCRYLKSGKIISFQSEVLRHQAVPVSLAFIGYPDSTFAHNLRKEGRIECNFPTKLEIGGKSCTGYIDDISPSGCKFVFLPGSEFPAEIGASVSGSFVTMEGGTNYEFKGEVMALKNAGNKKTIGVRFNGDITLPEKLQELVAQSNELLKGNEA